MTFMRMVATVVWLATCLVLGWAGGARAASGGFSVQSLKGRYVYHLDPATSFGGSALGNPVGVAAAGRQQLMRVGYMDFDGLLGVIPQARAIASTDDNAGQTILIDFMWTGTYVVNSDGTGTLSMTALSISDASCTPVQAVGVCATLVGPETYGIMVGKHINSVSLIQQDNAGGAKIFLRGEAIRQYRVTTPYFFTTGALKTRYKFQLGPATSFAAIAPGDPGGVAGAPRQEIMRVGYFNFNGFGMVDVSAMIATTDNNAGQTVIIKFNTIGSYSMSSDGTGTITLTPSVNDTSCTPAQAPFVCTTFEANPQTFAFALSKSRQTMYLMQTNTTAGAKISLLGEAIVQ